jgi:hypothetical protein
LAKIGFEMLQESNFESKTTFWGFELWKMLLISDQDLFDA